MKNAEWSDYREPAISLAWLVLVNRGGTKRAVELAMKITSSEQGSEVRASQAPAAPTKETETRPTCKCVEQGFPEPDCQWHGVAQPAQQDKWNYELQPSGDNYGPHYVVTSRGKAIGECLRVTDAKAIVAAHNASLAQQPTKNIS